MESVYMTASLEEFTKLEKAIDALIESTDKLIALEKFLSEEESDLILVKITRANQKIVKALS